MTIDLEFVSQLYREYASDLSEVMAAQRRFFQANARTMTPQLDDLEAEITYLLLRAFRPDSVVELGTFHGWSTTWILSALRDNGTGRLHSFDKIDNVVRNVPADLARDRWTFVQGDVKENLGKLPGEAGYLFVDAAHGGRFARWYIENLFPLVPAKTPVSVHDVFHGKRPLPLTEGAVLTRWLGDNDVSYFTASAAKDRESFQRLTELTRELGLGQVRGTTDNPMLYFSMPDPARSAAPVSTVPQRARTLRSPG